MRRVRIIREAELVPISDTAKKKIGKEKIRVELPSTVQAALVDAGFFDDPYYGDNYEQLSWINRVPWLYRIPYKKKSSKAKIIFHGVDYRYTIQFNDKILHEHEGMFSPATISLDNLPDEGVLDILVFPNFEEERIYRGKLRWPIKRNLRFPMSYGWDFAPKIITIGIWDLVEIVETNGTFIYNLKAKGNADGFLKISFEVEAESSKCTLDITLKDKESTVFAKQEKIELRNKQSVITLEYHIGSVEPWFPWDTGNPTLYDLEITILRDGEPLDSITEKVGFTTVKMRNSSLTINNKKVFLRGVNWVPTDSLLRYDKEKYRRLIRAVRELNANIIRVWGGGIRERKIFYELTDALGIMVWQEFPFACEIVDTSANILKTIEEESRSIVKYLRNHPSIVIWAGGNEMPKRNFQNIARILKRIIMEESPETPFHPVSPYRWDTHNWLVWHGYMPTTAYTHEKAKIISELGLQAIPNISTLQKFLPKNKIWPPNELWIKHNAELDKLYYYTYQNKNLITGILHLIENIIHALIGDKKSQIRLQLKYAKKFATKNLKEAILLSQLTQALAIKLAVEYYRTHKHYYNGVLIWQLNDPWPNISWSIIDHHEQKKIGYYTLKMSFEPLQTTLIPNKNKIDIHIINDHPHPEKGELTIKTKNKTIIKTTFSIGPNTALKISQIPKKQHPYTTIIRTQNKTIKNYYPSIYFTQTPTPKLLIGILRKISDTILN